MEGLAAIFPDLDAMTTSLDSRAFAGGKILIAAFDTSHYLNYFTGAPLAATLETPEVQLNPDGRAMVFNTRSAIDHDVDTAADGETVSVAAREMTQVTPVYGTAVVTNPEFGTAPQHVSGRMHRFKVVTDADAQWSHAQGVEVEFNKMGAR